MGNNISTPAPIAAVTPTTIAAVTKTRPTYTNWERREKNAYGDRRKVTLEMIQDGIKQKSRTSFIYYLKSGRPFVFIQDEADILWENDTEDVVRIPSKINIDCPVSDYHYETKIYDFDLSNDQKRHTMRITLAFSPGIIAKTIEDEWVVKR